MLLQLDSLIIHNVACIQRWSHNLCVKGGLRATPWANRSMGSPKQSTSKETHKSCEEWDEK